MALDREASYGALWARLQTLSGFSTIERRLRHWDDVPSEQQPYLGMAQTGEVPEYVTGRTTQWDLGVVLYLYVKTAGTPPGPIVNPLMDAITNLLAFDNVMDNACTLGGAVMWARMGSIETDEGTLEDQSVLRIPITLHVMG